MQPRVLHARGDYLVFLDQDALATPNWLAALNQTFLDIPGTGLSGAKLIRPDGRLLEAGAALWRDASRSAYGESDDALHPWYNFAREVDYCTAGCLMIPRDLFLELGGFDPDQSGPLCDADLAFRIRHSGHKVIYQPITRVIQHARVSAREQPSTEFRNQEQAHLRRFRERWRERLDSHPEPPRGLVRLLGHHHARQAALGQVLVIDHRLPTPDRDSGSFRMIEMIRAIKRRGHHVTFIPDNMVRILALSRRPAAHRASKSIHPPYYESIDDYLNRARPRVLASRSSRVPMSPQRHMDTARRTAPQARIVFDTVDLHFVREERQARIGEDPQTSRSRGQPQGARASTGEKGRSHPGRQPDREGRARRGMPAIELDVRILSNIHPVIEREHPGYRGSPRHRLHRRL